jgi:GntR family transcriptional regulator
MDSRKYSKEVASQDVLRMELERGNGKPVHDQIYLGIKRLIDRNELAVGCFLPPENSLAELWQVARGTVRRAINKLADEGILERRAGKGTWVASFKIQQFLGRLTSFTEDMRTRGLEPGSELLAIDSVAPGLSVQHLFGNDVQLVWKLVRRRFANGLPVAVETCYIRNSAADRHMLEQSEKISLYESYRSAGIRLQRAVQLVEAVNLSPELADLLEVKPGMAAFKQERISYGPRDEVIEVVESYYRGDLYKLQVELREFGQ